MKRRQCLSVIMGCAAMLVLWMGGCAAPGASDQTAELGDGMKISGPYPHENLTVFLVHATERDERDYITLDEGLKSKLVTVSEKKNATVRELIVNNKSECQITQRSIHSYKHLCVSCSLCLYDVA